MSRAGPYECPGCGAFSPGPQCEFCQRCEELGIVNGRTPTHRRQRRREVSG